jgi:hypothetical protein
MLMLEAATHLSKNPHPTSSSKKSKPSSSSSSSSYSSSEMPPHFADLDCSLWDEGTSEEEEKNSSFALALLNLLEEGDKLAMWVSQNRPCFALLEMTKVPAASSKLKTMLSKPQVHTMSPTHTRSHTQI